MLSKAGGRRQGVQAKSLTRRGKPGWSPTAVALSAQCKILDVSETGVRIESRLFVKSGDALQLAIELEQGRTLRCGLQVVHARSLRFGSKIASISPEDGERLAHIFNDRVQTSYDAGSPFPSYCLISWTGPHRPCSRLKTRSSISRSSASGTQSTTLLISGPLTGRGFSRLFKKAVQQARRRIETGATVLVVKPAEQWLATAFAV